MDGVDSFKYLLQNVWTQVRQPSASSSEIQDSEKGISKFKRPNPYIYTYMQLFVNLLDTRLNTDKGWEKNASS